MPSFMAKWSQAYPGCSGHIHQSLSDGKTNLFYDAKSPRRMSKLFESYLAGQVACLMEFAPMIWPTINSYKRLVDGFWAPVKPTWGIDNRTASFRVIAGSPKATRLETRCPGADVNPYLAMAAVIAAGLHGVEKGLKLTAPPITGTNQGAEHIPRAPRSLIETTRIFQRVGHRARLARRHLRRPLRRHPRVGVAPVAGRRDRLGTEALLRDHLKEIADDAQGCHGCWGCAARCAGAAERERHRDADEVRRHLGGGLRQAGGAAPDGRRARALTLQRRRQADWPAPRAPMAAFSYFGQQKPPAGFEAALLGRCAEHASSCSWR